MELDVLVEKGGRRSFSCRFEKSIGKSYPIGYGVSVQQAMDDFEKACIEFSELENNNIYVNNIQKYKFDIGSLFDYYNFLNIEGIAKLAGIKSSVLRQYASGARTPKPEKTKLIENAIKNASQQMLSIDLI